MRILVTNDDGIEAPGLGVLEHIAGGIAKDVWVVAPETDQSGAAHSLTLAEPLRMRELGRRRYAVKGTPTDCVIMGVRYLLADKPPALVLSGVNRGPNLADDVNFPDGVPGAVKGMAVTSQGQRHPDALRIEDRLDTRGKPYYWVGIERRKGRPPKGTDLWAVQSGRISVTPLCLDFTDEATRQRLAAKLGE